MNIILVLLIIAVLLILLWAFRGIREEAGKGAAAKTPASIDSTAEEIEPERTFRRRTSDRDIEQGYAEERHPSRRREDRRERTDDIDRTQKEPLNLPYPADSIISDSSRFRIYKRTLHNAEIYANKGDISTAISLFEGVKSRINDEDTLRMIDSDISYLKEYAERKSRAEEESASADRNAKSQTQIGGLRFTIDGQIPEGVNIGVIDPEINRQKEVTGEIINEISQLKNAIDEIKKSGFEDSRPEIKNYIDELKSQIGKFGKEKEHSLSEHEKLKDKYTAGDLADLKKNLEKISESAEKTGLTLEQLFDGHQGINKIKQNLSDIAGMKEDIKNLNRQLSELNQREQLSPRSPLDSDSQRPIPIHLDPAPFADLINAIYKGGSFSTGISGGDSAAQAPGYGSGKLHSPDSLSPHAPEKRPETDKQTIRQEEEDGFELLSEYDKDKDDDGLTDEDIFEKILKDSAESQKKDSFEIIGDKKSEKEAEIDIYDPEYEKKKLDNESFYRKLIKTDRKKKKELPILKVSYDFNKLPDEFSLSKEQNILEYSFYKYKPMLEKADALIKHRRVRDAINYYKVIMGQNIPPEMKVMVKRNINDLTEYLEKYLAAD